MNKEELRLARAAINEALEFMEEAYEGDEWGEVPDFCQRMTDYRILAKTIGELL